MGLMPQHIKPTPSKHCVHCATKLERKRFNGVLESMNCFLRRKYCNLTCSAAASTKDAVGEQTLMYRARKFVKDACETCGQASTPVRLLHVHHKNRDRTDNSADNIVTLCSSCHLKLHWKEDGPGRNGVAARCTVCGDKAKGRGYCQKHLARVKKHGDPHFEYTTDMRRADMQRNRRDRMPRQ